MQLAYTPNWVSLTRSLLRLTDRGTTAEGAKVDLCNAIADRMIDVRISVGGDEEFSEALLMGRSVGVPTRLVPKDFDWQVSRPVSNWYCGPYPGHIDWDERPIEFLELRNADLQALFPSTIAKLVPATFTSKSPNVSGRGKAKKTIQQAYLNLFPPGSSKPLSMSSQDRNDAIITEVTRLGLKPKPHTRTIERAIDELKRDGRI